MIPVVFSTDHNFIVPTSVAILSMLKCSTSDFDIFVLQTPEVTEEDRKNLEDSIRGFNSRIQFITIGNEFSQSFEVRGITKISYYRLLIPWLIPNYDWILYLDGDIIVKRDLKGIFNYVTDSDKLVYGVRTTGTVLDPDFSQHILSLGLDNTQYINGGVLLFNCTLMRKQNLKEQFLNHSDKEYFYQDQDIINLVCKDKIGWLPLKFNTSLLLMTVDKNKVIKSGISTNNDFMDAIKEPAIIHYAGKKPWKTFTPNWYDWWHIYSLSPAYNPQFDWESTKLILQPSYSVKQLSKMLLKKILNK